MLTERAPKVIKSRFYCQVRRLFVARQQHVTVVKIDVEKIGPEGLDLDEPVTRDWLDEMLGTRAEFHPAEDGRLAVHLARMDDVVHVRGHARFHLKASCSRCLAPADLHLDTPVEVTMVPREIEPQAGADGEIADDDTGVSTYENREIDLTSLVRDEVFLELPMRALCTPDCRGLCATCGKNLNEGDCGCEPQMDERWGALQRIKLN